MTRSLDRSFDHSTNEVFVIHGGERLRGETVLPGAKNAALPAIVAACLSDEVVTLENVPTELKDVQLLLGLLTQLGAVIQEPKPHTLLCSGKNWSGGPLPATAGDLRHSLLLLGASARWRTSLFLPFPGGCKLGDRKHDMHITALEALGSEVRESDNGLSLAPSPIPEDPTIAFHYPTFGGTLNALFGAVTLEGKRTIIKNAARNPEVADVIELLTSMGADISWLDGSTLRITGRAKLSGTSHQVICDRIIAATVVAATAVTHGHTFIRNASTSYLKAEVTTWQAAGLEVHQASDGIEVKCKNRLRPSVIRTEAYPGFHTDIQPLHATMMLLARGTSLIRETILDGRFRYATELSRMGAKVTVVDGGFTCVNGSPGQMLIIDGVTELVGSSVRATDIRGGAALAVAGLAARGETVISNVYQIERGYADFCGMFSNLGGSVKKATLTSMTEAAPAVPA